MGAGVGLRARAAIAAGVLTAAMLPSAVSWAAPERTTAPTAEGGDEASSAAPAAEWTVMVYLAADNNLEVQALIDLEEMAAAAGPNANILALVDRSAQDFGNEIRADDGLLDLPPFHDAKLLRILPGSAEVLVDVGEIDMTDPQNLAWFTWYGLTEFPAERNALIMWNHGGAALIPFGEDVDNEGTFFDTTALQQAIGSALTAAEAPRLDLIGFDVCLNATLEIARAMAPYGDVMVASEELEAGHGWDWTALSVLQEPGTTPEELARTLVDRYEVHSKESPFGGQPDYTQSAIDLSQIDRLDQALAGFVRAVRRHPEAGSALLQARQGVIEFGAVGADQKRNYHQVDLGDLFTRLPSGVPDDVRVARDSVLASLDRTVIHSIAGPAHAGASGLAIQLPSSAEYYKPLYDEHADPSGWRDLVKAILGGDLQGGVAAATTTGDLTLAAAEREWSATMTLGAGTDVALSSGIGVFGRAEGDAITALTLVPATIGDDQVVTRWSYQHLRIDGQPVTARVEALSDGFRATIDGVYIEPSGTQVGAALQLDITFEGGALQVGSSTFYGGAGGLAAISPTAGARFAPALLRVTGDGGAETTYQDVIEPVGFSVEVDEIGRGERFATSIIARQPAGPTLVQTATATRP